MALAIPRQTTLSSRAVSLLSGVLMTAIALSSVPGLDYTTTQAHGLKRVKPIDVVEQVDVAEVGANKPARKALPSGFQFNQETITSYLANEWNLGWQYASQVSAAVLSAAKRHGVDPLLLMAVAATESSFQHSVGNPGGGSDPMKPYGIMQVAGRWHPDKFPEGVAETTVKENVDIGAQVIKEYLAIEGGNERRALLRYNGSLNISDKYFNTVTRFKQKLIQGLSAQKYKKKENPFSTDTNS